MYYSLNLAGWFSAEKGCMFFLDAHSQVEYPKKIKEKEKGNEEKLRVKPLSDTIVF